MRRWNNVMLGLCIAAATTACAGDQPADSTAANDPAAVGTSGTPAATPDATAGMGDVGFISDMLADARTEIDLGTLAQEKAQSKEVKAFAALVVRDRTKAADELKTVATQASVDVTAIDADMDQNTDLHERLAELSGAEFDREYMKAMVEDHEAAIDTVEEQATGADSEHVKAWAAKTLPTLKAQLEQARQIHDGLEQRSGV